MVLVRVLQVISSTFLHDAGGPCVPVGPLRLWGEADRRRAPGVNLVGAFRTDGAKLVVAAG